MYAQGDRGEMGHPGPPGEKGSTVRESGFKEEIDNLLKFPCGMTVSNMATTSSPSKLKIKRRLPDLSAMERQRKKKHCCINK